MASVCWPQSYPFCFLSQGKNSVFSEVFWEPLSPLCWMLWLCMHSFIRSWPLLLHRTFTVAENSVLFSHPECPGPPLIEETVPLVDLLSVHLQKIFTKTNSIESDPAEGLFLWDFQGFCSLIRISGPYCTFINHPLPQNWSLGEFEFLLSDVVHLHTHLVQVVCFLLGNFSEFCFLFFSKMRCAF